MKLSYTSLVASVVLGLGLAACGGTATSAPAPSKPTGTVSAALVFKAPCAASACPDAPTSAGGSQVCASSGGGATACAWSEGGGAITGVGNNDDPNSPVSWRECAANECTGPEIASACPAGTKSLGLRCGSENDAACASYAVCVPDTDAGATVTCGDDDCGPRPEIAAVCDDGTTHELVCRAQGSHCVYVSPCP